jgi:glutathione S-transferase
MSPSVSVVTIMTLFVFLVVTLNVGRAREKYGIKAPNVSGDLDFERVLRVQQNTLEQLILFLPALWIFSVFVSPIIATILGAVWIIGRIIYALGYYQAAEKRRIGFAISTLATLVLLLGSLGGIIIHFVKG